MTDYPHVPVGKLYYRASRPEISNHNGQRFEVLNIQVGYSQRWMTRDEVNIRIQTDSELARWYGASLEARTPFGWLDDAVNPFKLADKIRARFIKIRQETSQECELAGLIETLRQMKAVHAVYDNRTSRIVPVKEVMPEGFSAWRDDWAVMERESCTLSAVARDADEARAMMVLEAKSDGVAYMTDYLKVWLEKGAPVKRLSGICTTPEVVYLESFLKPQAEKAA